MKHYTEEHASVAMYIVRNYKVFQETHNMSDAHARIAATRSIRKALGVERLLDAYMIMIMFWNLA